MAPTPTPGDNPNTHLSKLEPIFYQQEESDPGDTYFQGIIIIMLTWCLASLLYCLIF